MNREQLFQKNIKIAYNISSKYLINYRKEYEDIKQVALMGLWKAVLHYKGNNKFSNFAYIVTINEVNQYLRNVKKSKSVCSLQQKISENMTLEDIIEDETDELSDYENKLQEIKAKEVLNEIVKHLKIKEQQIYYSYIKGKKQIEIAKELKIGQPQVSKTVKKIAKLTREKCRI